MPVMVFDLQWTFHCSLWQTPRMLKQFIGFCARFISLLNISKIGGGGLSCLEIYSAISRKYNIYDQNLALFLARLILSACDISASVVGNFFVIIEKNIY